MTAPHKPTESADWQWNPYAEAYDLTVTDIADMEAATEAARSLSVVIDSLPGWLAEAAGLDKAIAILDNVTVKDGAD
jgi:hypothetical protein